MDEFGVSVVRAEGSSVLAVAGDFDLASAGRFHEARDVALADQGPVIVDLSECGFIDSTGISCVIRTFQLAGQAGRPFALVGSALRMKVLELTGLPELVPYFDTRDEALQALDGKPSPDAAGRSEPESQDGLTRQAPSFRFPPLREKNP